MIHCYAYYAVWRKVYETHTCMHMWVCVDLWDETCYRCWDAHTPSDGPGFTSTPLLVNKIAITDGYCQMQKCGNSEACLTWKSWNRTSVRLSDVQSIEITNNCITNVVQDTIIQVEYNLYGTVPSIIVLVVSFQFLDFLWTEKPPLHDSHGSKLDYCLGSSYINKHYIPVPILPFYCMSCKLWKAPGIHTCMYFNVTLSVQWKDSDEKGDYGQNHNYLPLNLLVITCHSTDA